MLLVAPTKHLSRIYSLEETVKILADTGYKAFDLTLCGENGGRNLSDSEDYRERAVALRKQADKLGVLCVQAHAVAPTSVGDIKKDASIFDKIVRDMEVASILGAEIIAVHPKQPYKYADYANELFELNMEFYKSLIPYCEKFGIKIAIENMWQRNKVSGSICDSTCSMAWEFCKYIDTLNSEWIVGLLDVGHTALVDADLMDFIKTLGKDRLKALHIHDNDKKHDSHTLPFIGDIDFNVLTTALAEIGYEGNFTFETHGFLEKFPKELLYNASVFMRQVGEYLIKEIEKISR